MPVSVITGKMDFFSRIEKIHKNRLSSSSFSKRNEKERGFIELTKNIVENRITGNSDSDTTNETSDW